MPNIALLNRGLRLTPGTRSQIYVDAFDALSSRWVAQAGSLAVSGGALQAATLGDWGQNLVSNSEFTLDTADWTTESGVSISRVDSEVDPGASSVTAGAADKWVLKVETTTGTYTAGQNSVSAGRTVMSRGYLYSPSSNTGTNSLGVGMLGYGTTQTTDEDVWQWVEKLTQLTRTRRIWLCMATAGDTGYADALEVYMQNAPVLLTGWRSPNHVTTLSHISPASGVVPFSYICRYTDSLNYWEVRVLPNTEGNDLQIVQVTDGVETTRAEADVDWTSDDTDELMVDCRGSTIATYHRKSGAGTWTAGPSYASATQGQTSPDVGVMLYEAGVGRLSGFEIRAI